MLGGQSKSSVVLKKCVIFKFTKIIIGNNTVLIINYFVSNFIFGLRSIYKPKTVGSNQASTRFAKLFSNT